jgi:hypothetical protein
LKGRCLRSEPALGLALAQGLGQGRGARGQGPLGQPVPGGGPPLADELGVGEPHCSLPLIRLRVLQLEPGEEDLGPVQAADQPVLLLGKLKRPDAVLAGEPGEGLGLASERLRAARNPVGEVRSLVEHGQSS